MSQAETEANWRRMLSEADAGKRASDEKGPRGFRRVFVHTKDHSENYADVSRSRMIQQVETFQEADRSSPGYPSAASVLRLRPRG